MSKDDDDCPPHPQPTRNGRFYCFSVKHHRLDDSNDAQWLRELRRDEEFGIFALADERDLSDESGNLYGLRLGINGEVLELGTRGQQIAKFPLAHPNQPWHGYPLWPLKPYAGGSNRGAKKVQPSKLVFVTMERAGLLTERNRKRLQKGDQIR